MATKGYALIDAATGLVLSSQLPTEQYRSVTTTPYNVVAADNFIECSGSAASVVLPSAVTAGAGKRYIIKNSGTSVITITASAGSMDGNSTMYLAVQYQSLVFESNGTNWMVAYAYKTPPESRAMYSDSTTQTFGHVGGADDAYPIQFDTTELGSGFTRDNGGAGTTVTISQANPGVITWTGHTFVNGDTVYFTTDGSLPTGLTVNTKYYVVSSAANTFSVATYPGGTGIQTTSAGSGTHKGHDSARIYATSSGDYLMAVSAICDLTATTNKHIELWLNVNGSNVARSNTLIEMPSANIEQILAVTFISTLTAGQYFKLMSTADSTNCQFVATAAGVNPTRPASPSIIVTVNKISK